MNPNTHPDLQDATLHAAVTAKTAAARQLLEQAVCDFTPVALANSLGAEDMVLTDLVVSADLPVEIFTLDTGRLNPETYELMAALEKHYGIHLKYFYPRHEAIEAWTRTHGINAFYESVTLRKACCHIRKVEPLQRALIGKRAWITGQRAEQSSTRSELPTQQFDEANGLEKFNPLAEWSWAEVWFYIRTHGVPYNALHEQGYPSIGCAPCTRAITIGEDIRAGRWWWENADSKECGLHSINRPKKTG